MYTCIEALEKDMIDDFCDFCNELVENSNCDNSHSYKLLFSSCDYALKAGLIHSVAYFCKQCKEKYKCPTCPLYHSRKECLRFTRNSTNRRHLIEEFDNTDEEDSLKIIRKHLTRGISYRFKEDHEMKSLIEISSLSQIDQNSLAEIYTCKY